MSNFSNFYAKRLKKGHFKDFFFAIKRSTANNFYAKRLKKVLFEQLKKMIPKSGGGGGCDPPNPPYLAPVDTPHT